MSGKRYFGSVRKLPSGRFQARYTGPDGVTHTARTDDGRPLTFDSRQYADAYLSRVHGDIQADRWISPDAPKPAAAKTLRDYAEAWLPAREVRGKPLSPGTITLYRKTLANQVYPTFGESPLDAITAAAVRDWYGKLRQSTGPTQRAHAYALLHAILATAVADDILTANPCKIRSASQTKRARKIEPATLAELELLVKAMPERYRLMVLLAAWCALRFGELAELRRSDIDVRNGVVKIRRGVIRADEGRIVQDPKSDAGKRDVAIPPHLLPAVKDHLRDHTGAGRDALVFPAASGAHMAPSSLYAVYFPARKKAGRPDLNFHDLRHTGAVLAAATGATLAELMARLGHSTVDAAMLYQHAAAERDKVIAAALSDLATVTPISAAKGGKRKKAAS